MKKKLKSKIEKTIKKLSGGLFSEVIYKYEPIENKSWEHTNFIIRFIFSSNKFIEDLIEFLIKSNNLNKAMMKYKEEYHIIIGGELRHFIQLIKNTSNTNNKFFKETIGLLYYLDKNNFEEFINNNIMSESRFIETPNSPIFKPLEIDAVHLDDIEYMYNKLNGLLSYRELLDLTLISYFDTSHGFYENKFRSYSMNEFIRNHDGWNSFIKEILKEHLEPIIGNLDQYKIDNYFVELKDEKKYISVDEPMGNVVEEEFEIKENEDGNLEYNKDNFI
ncbi:MAG: hypothetical protein M0P99_00890 [Candidatus Cloacimonetes bacterium]|nr:hypothetical protein [Candidatus Cloacimonadota bacterium]